MIGKAATGAGFRGLLSYLLTGSDRRAGRVAWTAARNLPTTDPELVPAIMRATASRSSRVEKPVYHLSVSLDPGEQLDRDAFEKVVDRTLRDLGLEQHQALVVAHDDTAHPHVHVMVNRVPIERGPVWDNSWDWARIERSLRHQERELGLREVPGRHYTLDRQIRYDGAEPSSGDRRERRRTGEPTFAEEVRAVVRRELRDAGSWGELHRRLADVGLQLEKRGRGLALTDGERRVKASAVDRRSSLAGLEKRLGRWQPPETELFPAGKSERWGEVVELRRRVRRLARDRDAAELRHRRQRQEAWDRRQADRLRQEIRQRIRIVSAELGRRLDRVYRDPNSARRAVEGELRRRGAEATARSLRRHPDRFGKLLGRGRPLTSPERWAALEEAENAAPPLLDLADLRRQLESHRTPGERAVAAVRTATRSVGRATRRQLTRQIRSLGWKLAARVLPPPHFHLLRLTLGVGRKALEAALGRDRGRTR